MPGYTSGDYLRFLKSFDLFKTTKPDVILLQLGTNDVRTDYAHTETPQFVENVKNIIYLIRRELYSSTPPLVLISTVLPIEPSPPVFTEQSVKRIVGEINPAIRRIAGAFDVRLVDNFELFKNHREWLIDGVHPNEQGLGRSAYPSAA